MNNLILLLARLIFLAPLASLILIILDRGIFHRVREKTVKRYIAISQLISFAAVSISCVWILQSSSINLEVLQLNLVRIGNESLILRLKLDQLSAAFIWMSCFLGGIVGLFASRYLHKDPGFFRFFVLYHIFILGMQFIVLGANLPSIFVGWELVGLSSALLISFFAYRRQTVVNSLRAFWAYRITDCGLLTASLIAMHYGVKDISELASLTSGLTANYIVLACLFSAMGKSALFPFGSWLPKAMEGPTPSSAIFYGGLSVHAGLYLMLRISHSFNFSWKISFVICLLGLVTMIYASLLGKIQNDVKSALAYAAMSQVGLMFVLLGFGLHKLVILLFVGHALLRTYQLLNASNLIHERSAFERVLGKSDSRKGSLPAHLHSFAFWESCGGMLNRVSFLDLIDFIAKQVSLFDKFLADLNFKIIRNFLYLLKQIRHNFRLKFLNVNLESDQ